MKAFLRVGWRGLVAGVVASGVLLGGASMALAAPGNDDFAQARSLRVGTTVKGSINGATKQRGEPRHANSSAKHSVWYRFRTSRTRAIAVSTCKTSFDSVVAVYTGRLLRALHEVEFNNDGCNDYRGGSRVTFTARPGRTYWIAVAAFDRRGSFRLKVAAVAVPPNDDFVDAVPIRLGSSVAGTTRNATRELREPAHDDDDPHTVWYRFRVAGTRTVRLAACNGVYPGIVVYTGGRVDRLTRIRFTTANHCAAQFTALPGVTYRVALASREGGGFRLAARIPNRPPANDNFADASPITLGTTINGTTRNATREPGEGGGGSFTVWYRLTLTEATNVRVENDNCDFLSSDYFAFYAGAQLGELDNLGFLYCPGGDMSLQPGVYSLQFESPYESDFSFRVQAVAPPP